jgi:hypothetical protein
MRTAAICCAADGAIIRGRRHGRSSAIASLYGVAMCGARSARIRCRFIRANEWKMTNTFKGLTFVRVIENNFMHFYSFQGYNINSV